MKQLRILSKAGGIFCCVYAWSGVKSTTIRLNLVLNKTFRLPNYTFLGAEC